MSDIYIIPGTMCNVVNSQEREAGDLDANKVMWDVSLALQLACSQCKESRYP